MQGTTYYNSYSGMKAIGGVLIVMKDIWKKNLLSLQASIAIGGVLVTLRIMGADDNTSRL